LAPHVTDLIESEDIVQQRASIRQRGYLFDGDRALADIPDVDIPPDEEPETKLPDERALANAYTVRFEDPEDMKAALLQPDAAEWIAAELEEKESWKYHQVAEVVPRAYATSHGKRIFDSKEVLAYKYLPPDDHHPEGSLRKRKYRLTIAAYTKMLKEGVDYKDKHANTVRWNALKTLVALAVRMDYDIHLFDIKTFFLFGELEEEIYMKIPDRWAEGGECGPDYIWRLRRSAYGLPQAPNCAQKVLRAAYLDGGQFKNTQSDDCLYVTTNHKSEVDPVSGISTPSTGYCASGTHVDDILSIGDKKGIAKLRAALHAKFKETNVTEEKDPLLLVGVQLERVRGKRWAKLHQTDYTTRLLEKYSMEHSRPVDTPMDPGTAKVFMLLPRDEHTPESLALFRAILGCLLWLEQRTRLDLDYCVCLFSRVAHCASLRHYEIATGRPLRYLNGTRSHGIIFDPGPEELWGLSGSSDADFAGDLYSSRSILSTHTKMGKTGCTHNSTALEKKICTSTGQAETYAFASLAKELLWARHLLVELGFPQRGPTVAYTDNDGVNLQSEKAVNHSAVKHYRVAQHFIRQLCTTKVLESRRVDTDWNESDLGTKPLGAVAFARHVQSIMGDQQIPMA
jgi:hypothetical protein